MTRVPTAYLMSPQATDTSLSSRRADIRRAPSNPARSPRTARQSWTRSIFSPMTSHPVPGHWSGREVSPQRLPTRNFSGHITTRAMAARTSLTETSGPFLPPRETRVTKVNRVSRARRDRRVNRVSKARRVSRAFRARRANRASRARRARPAPQVQPVRQALQSHGRAASKQLRPSLNCIGLITIPATAARTSLTEPGGLSLHPRETRVTKVNRESRVRRESRESRARRESRASKVRRESRASRARRAKQVKQVPPAHAVQTEYQSSGKAASQQLRPNRD